MGKKKGRKPSALRSAAEQRSIYRKWLMLLAIGIVICVIAVFVYMYLSTSGALHDTGIVPWVVAVIAAGVLGTFSNKFSKTRRAYEETLERYGLSDEDVRNFVNTSK